MCHTNQAFKKTSKKLIEIGYFNTTRPAMITKLIRNQTLPYQINCYEFLSQIDLDKPNKVLQQFLFALEIYLTDNLILAKNEIFLFIDCLWKKFAYVHRAYLALTMIPFFLTFAMAFIIFDKMNRSAGYTVVIVALCFY